MTPWPSSENIGPPSTVRRKTNRRKRHPQHGVLTGKPSTIFKRGSKDMEKIVTYGRYAGSLRHLALRMKDGRESALRRAAEIFAGIIPQDAVVVPMPSRTGRATAMLRVAEYVATIRPDVLPLDALESDAHESMYLVKKRGDEPRPFAVRLVGRIPTGREIVIIDNVTSSGTTARCALSAIPSASVMAIAKP